MNGTWNNLEGSRKLLKIDDIFQKIPGGLKRLYPFPEYVKNFKIFLEVFTPFHIVPYFTLQ